MRLFGLIVAAAFLSLGTQIVGLVGAHGITPAVSLLEQAKAVYDTRAWSLFPSLFWLHLDDLSLVVSCLVGALGGLLISFGVARGALLLVCYLLYLSLFSVGQAFMHFQWDLLLLETLAIALLVVLHHRSGAVMMRVLLFKFMFLSGCVKLLSGDQNWWSLSALNFHFETQPLPTPLAWWAHHLPDLMLSTGVAATLVIELCFPFLIFAPRRPRLLAAAGFLALELLIGITGNYNFFNLLTIALCLFMIDEASWQRLRLALPFKSVLTQSDGRRLVLAPIILLMLALNVLQIVVPFTGAPTKNGFEPFYMLSQISERIRPFCLVNGYGLFAVMTTERPEIEVQGSADGKDWRTYEFRYKPGTLDKRLGWIIPHQPRLDWQMWFAALSRADRTPWFDGFLLRLLENEPAVTDLLGMNPFSDSAPRFVRAQLYRYHFTSPQERQVSRQVWRRELVGQYYPAVSLR